MSRKKQDREAVLVLLLMFVVLIVSGVLDWISRR